MSQSRASILHRLPRRNTVFAAITASLITFLITIATRPQPRTRFVAADGSITPVASLDRMVKQIQLTKKPLRQAIDVLSALTGVSMRLHLQSLASAGVNADTPVNVDLTDVTAGRVLTEILASTKPTAQLDYWSGDDGVEIGTLKEEQSTLVTRVYDVSELAKDVVSRGRSHWLIPGGWNYQPTSSTPSNDPTPVTYPEAEAILEKWISDTIDSDSWKDNGGTIGSSRCLFGKLGIIQTPHNQEAIEAMLYRLSQPQALEPPPRGIVMPDHSLRWPTTQ